MSVTGVFVEGYYAGLHRRCFSLAGGVPVVLTRSGRVVDACREASEGGVRPGMSMTQARVRLPDAHFAALDTRSYGPEVERLARAAVRLSPDVEVYHPHRVFVGIGDSITLLCFLQRLLRGLTGDLVHRVFLGRGPGKYLAEIALNEARHRGEGWQIVSGRWCSAAIIPPGDGGYALASLPLSRLGRLPRHVVQCLSRLGISRFGEIGDVSLLALQERIGPGWAQTLSGLSRGEDGAVVNTNYPPPRLYREREVGGWSREGVQKALCKDIWVLAKEMLQERLAAGQVELWFLERGCGWSKRKREFSRPRSDRHALEFTLLRLWETSDIPGPLRYRIEISRLQSPQLSQVSFLQQRTSGDRETVEKTMKDLVFRYSGHAAFWGEQLAVSRRERMLAQWDPLRWG